MKEENLEQAAYDNFVRSLEKTGTDILTTLGPEKAELWHMGTLAAGEAGELLDEIKKHVVYDKELDLTNVIEELGDLEFAMSAIRRKIGVSRKEVLDLNRGKLEKRYHEGSYLDAHAQERADKESLPDKYQIKINKPSVNLQFEAVKGYRISANIERIGVGDNVPDDILSAVTKWCPTPDEAQWELRRIVEGLNAGQNKEDLNAGQNKEDQDE